MRSRWTPVLLIAVATMACAECAQSLSTLPGPDGERTTSVYVVRHGWHTGIILRSRDISTVSWPEHADFDSEYVEIGWGDRDFYQAPKGTSGLALKAAFGRTRSVLHIVGFDERPERFFPGREIVEIKVSAGDFDRLSTFVHAAYARDSGGHTLPLGPGQYPNSRFYAAVERYSLLRTCNQWIARALRSAGCPMAPASAITAGSLMRQTIDRCGATTMR